MTMKRCFLFFSFLLFSSFYCLFLLFLTVYVFFFLTIIAVIIRDWVFLYSVDRFAFLFV